MKQVLPEKIDALNSVISFTKKCFSKPQFKQATKYVTGLITLSKKSISSTNTEKSAVQIIRTYSERWSIETFHRDLKQTWGWKRAKYEDERESLAT